MVKIDPAVLHYDPKSNGYDIALDPRCLYGWGPPAQTHLGYCSRELGHPGLCVDHSLYPGDPGRTRRRPKNWDTRQREECNR